MNSPTIAAVVPGVRPQAGRAPSAEAATDESPRFADVLAGHAPPAQDADRVDTPSDAKPSADADPAVEPGAPSAKVGDAADQDTGKADTDLTDDVLAALPQIALEIASHARSQANPSRAPAGGQSIPAAAGAGAPAANVRSAVARHHGTDAPGPAGDALRAETFAQPQEAKEPGLQAQAGDAGRATQASAAPILADSGHGRATPAGLAAARRQPAAQVSAPMNANVAAMAQQDSGQDRALRATSTSTPAGDSAFVQVHMQSVQGETSLRNTAAMPAVEAPAAAPAGLNPFIQAATPSPTAAAIATPLHHPEWNTDFGRQVVMMARDAHGGAQTAELRLDPPELGPLRISLSLNDGMASAVFVSAHASVRQAVESALPQLSQQLAQAGISLGQTHVGDHGQAGFAFHDDGGRTGGRSAGGGGGSDHAVSVDTAPPARANVVSDGLVDTFA